jgi:molecular chaperone DnaK (HSP70)
VQSDYRYIVGIDLGTTNCAVSYVDLQQIDPAGGKSAPDIRSFKVPQLTGPGEVTRQAMLPSFLYLTGDYEITKDAVALPWPTSDDYVSGTFARNHGARVPSRLVSSAKSWLCHGRVDRRAKILPWGAPESVGKVSPVQSTAAYLTHIRKAWQHAHSDDPELVLENQMVIVTVPASFDEVARDLTLEAASLAGLGRITLIEEPLAAFYSWLIRNEKNWQQHLTPGELVLVCDVGGGTTDFTLITLCETKGSPRFERLAVGDHLILGGDNMDLALARSLEDNFSKRNVKMTADRYKMLCHQCRQAKEAVLSGEKETGTVTLMGEGSKLIAGTVRLELTKAAVEKSVLEDFFPLVSQKTPPPAAFQKTVGEFGLPYEPQQAITQHLGEFLERHGAGVKSHTGKDRAIPDLILFNGGALKSSLIKERIRDAIRHWFKIDDERLPRVLENPDQDLAVSLGASYYGLVKAGIGVRVGSGAPRAYYLGISREEQAEESRDAVCLVERGLDEGSRFELKETLLKVLTNQPVRFDVYSSSFRSGDRLGDMIPVDDSFTTLPPVQTVIEFGKKGKQTNIPVMLEGEYTEMGTLSLWVRSETTSHRWQLQFQLRDTPSPLAVQDRTILEASEVETVRDMVRSGFGTPSGRKTLASLVKNIARSLDLKKESWPLSMIRQISDDLMEMPGDQRRLPEAESRWMNLLGYCLRPGRGDGFDVHRIKKLWKLYKPGPMNPKNPQVRSEWWILWRRAAAGLGPGHQRQVSQDLSGLLITGKGKKRSLPDQERLEAWMLIANLEQLLSKDKVRLGRQLLGEIKNASVKPQYLWAISRIGARELLYGPADRVVPPGEAFSWCKTLMEIPWRSTRNILPAVARMARKTGDRIRDLDDPKRDEILGWMASHEGPEDLMNKVREIVPMATEEESTLFGETLPTGLVMHEP